MPPDSIDQIDTEPDSDTTVEDVYELNQNEPIKKMQKVDIKTTESDTGSSESDTDSDSEKSESDKNIHNIPRKAVVINALTKVSNMPPSDEKNETVIDKDSFNETVSSEESEITEYEETAHLDGIKEQTNVQAPPEIIPVVIPEPRGVAAAPPVPVEPVKPKRKIVPTKTKIEEQKTPEELPVVPKTEVTGEKKPDVQPEEPPKSPDINQEIVAEEKVRKSEPEPPVVVEQKNVPLKKIIIAKTLVSAEKDPKEETKVEKVAPEKAASHEKEPDVKPEESPKSPDIKQEIVPEEKITKSLPEKPVEVEQTNVPIKKIIITKNIVSAEKDPMEETNVEKVTPEKIEPEKVKPENVETEKVESEPPVEVEQTNVPIKKIIIAKNLVSTEKDPKEETKLEKVKPEKIEPEKIEPEKAESEKAEPKKAESEKVKPEKAEQEPPVEVEQNKVPLKKIIIAKNLVSAEKDPTKLENVKPAEPEKLEPKKPEQIEEISPKSVDEKPKLSREKSWDELKDEAERVQNVIATAAAAHEIHNIKTEKIHANQISQPDGKVEIFAKKYDYRILIRHHFTPPKMMTKRNYRATKKYFKAVKYISQFMYCIS